MSRSGSSTRIGVPLFGMALEEGLQKVLFIMVDVECEDVYSQGDIGTLQFLGMCLGDKRLPMNSAEFGIGI